MHRKWSQAVQNATLETYPRIMFGPRAYDRHAAKCKICGKIKATQGETK